MKIFKLIIICAMICGLSFTVLHAKENDAVIDDALDKFDTDGDSESDEDNVDQQFEGFNLQGYTEGGNKAWVVNGDTADIMGNTIKINNVQAETFDEDPMNLTAEIGVVEKSTGNIHLENDVVITTESGSKLTTETLDWKRNDDLVTTDDFVTITNEHMITTGTGLEGHPNLKTAQMNEDVTMKVNPDKEKKEDQTITITSDGPLEIDQLNSIAIFNDNVVAIQLNRRLEADKMEIFFDQENNQIEKMICTGNVMVKNGENESYSESAIYYAKDQKMILSGRPKLILQTDGENSIASFGE